MEMKIGDKVILPKLPGECRERITSCDRCREEFLNDTM